MLIVVCGEDPISARKYYLEIKNKLEKKDYYVVQLPAEDIESINEDANANISLFGQKKAYFTDNLNRRVTVKNKDFFTNLNKLPDTYVVDWEGGKSAYELKIAKLGTVKEFRPDTSIFRLQEALYPGNRNVFIKTLSAVSSNQDEQFIFLMIVRYTRSLLLAKNNALPSKIAPWQKKKITQQASMWGKPELLKFYEGLHRIDLNLKSGLMPSGLVNALDTLACYFI